MIIGLIIGLIIATHKLYSHILYRYLQWNFPNFKLSMDEKKGNLLNKIFFFIQCKKLKNGRHFFLRGWL